jgi:hypothetical protein
MTRGESPPLLLGDAAVAAVGSHQEIVRAYCMTRSLTTEHGQVKTDLGRNLIPEAISKIGDLHIYHITSLRKPLVLDLCSGVSPRRTN